MKKQNGITLIKLVIAIIIVILVVGFATLGIAKFIKWKKTGDSSLEGNDNDTTKISTELSTKEDEIIQTIRDAFNALREEAVVKMAFNEGYQPSDSEKGEGNIETGNAVELKNIIVSKLGENVVDESKESLSEINLEEFHQDGEKISALKNGYHVYLSVGEEENEKFITIIYKDSSFNHGMAHYDTENNLVTETSNGTYPILVAQIRLSADDASYYLEPVKSVK